MARVTDESGFFGLWLTDSSLRSRDCSTLLGALAGAPAHPSGHRPHASAHTPPGARGRAAATLDEPPGGRAIPASAPATGR